MWYIFEKRIVQGYQKLYTHVPNTKIQRHKYTITQIHKYSVWRSARKTQHIVYFWKEDSVTHPCIMYFVFPDHVYFVFVFLVFARLTHGNIIFDTLEQSSFQKYAICWVFPALGNVLYLCICVFVYLYLCIFVWDTWEYQFRYPWTKSFQKMYGLYGLKHHKVERLKRWQTNKQTDRQNFLL